MPPPLSSKKRRWQSSCPTPRLREEYNLLKKATKDNDSLTDKEREAILDLSSIEDALVRKALAFPGSLSETERAKLLGWPSAEERNANVAKVTGGAVLGFDEFVQRASANLSWLDFAKARLIADQYHDEPPAHQDDDLDLKKARQCVRTKEEAQARSHAIMVLEGSAVHNRKLKLDAGELNEEESQQERDMHAKAKERFERDARQETPNSTAWSLVSQNGYRPAKSDEDLYANYWARLTRERAFAQEMLRERKEFGFAIYHATELRDGHDEEQREFRKNYRQMTLPSTGFLTRLATETDPSLASVGSANDALVALTAACATTGPGPRPTTSFNWSQYQRVHAPEVVYAECPISFEFFWREYLTWMLKVAHAGHGKAWWGVVGDFKDLADLAQYQAPDFEASELEPGSFRRHFCEMRRDGLVEEAVDSRYFLLCTRDGTPGMTKAFDKGKRRVWVIDADWEPPEGKEEEEDGFKGMLKTSFTWTLFVRLGKQIQDSSFDMKEAWGEMQERPREEWWDVLY